MRWYIDEKSEYYHEFHEILENPEDRVSQLNLQVWISQREDRAEALLEWLETI